MTQWIIEAIRVNRIGRVAKVKWRPGGGKPREATVREVREVIEKGDTVRPLFPGANGETIGPRVVVSDTRLKAIRTERDGSCDGKTLLEVPRF